MEIDINAPIIPYRGLGGINLYSTREELNELLVADGVKVHVYDNWIEYDIQDKIALTFHLTNEKLLRISTLKEYKGKLFDKICVGMPEEEIPKADSSFVYNDFEEFWESDKGVSIVTDVITHRVLWIAVYISEWGSKGFEEGEW